jgi:D-3-phosphoglycerate dehydrogenase
MKILLTSTSFQDTPGKHHDQLNLLGYEVDYLRGPLKKEELLPIIGKYQGVICGDDEYTAEVLQKGKEGELKVISKYGIGLDKIDLQTARSLQIIVKNCVGVNHVTVAEHVFALILSYAKNILDEVNYTRKGEWKRLTGTEIYGKTLGILGLGKIGKEVAKRALAFGMNVVAYDKFWDEEFEKNYQIQRSASIRQLVSVSDYLSLNMDLNAESRGILSSEIINNFLKPGCVIINTARGELINYNALVEGLKIGKIKAYLTDVLHQEPMPQNYELKDFKNVFITPHIGSRTFESVERQGIMAVQNLYEAFKSLGLQV